MVDSKVSQEMNKQMHRKGGFQRLVADLKEFQRQGVIRADVILEKTAVSLRGQSFYLGFVSMVVLNRSQIDSCGDE